MYVRYRGTSTVIQTMSVAINQVPVFEMESDWQNSVFFIICDGAVSRLGDEWGFGKIAGLTYFDGVCSRVLQSQAYCQFILQFTIIIYTIQVRALFYLSSLFTVRESK